MDAKELIKRELPAIYQMDAKADYGNKKYVNDALAYISKYKIIYSPYGQQYEKRLKDLAAGNTSAYDGFTCLVCQKSSGSKMICPSCKQRLGGYFSSSAPAASGGSITQTVKSAASAINVAASGVIQNQTVKDTADVISKNTKKTVDKLTEKVNVMLGGEGKVDLRLRDLLSQVFMHHSSNETDELFSCGTPGTTPSFEEISTAWPKPWLFSRVALVLIATFYLLMMCFYFFGNTNAIPGIIFIGSLAIPFSMLVFLFEINAPRNISIFKVVVVFLQGGAESLLITLVLYQINGTVTLDTIGGAVIVGIIEELGKIISLAYMINKLQTTKFILNGMLIGGAVGAGFAVFESAGYAFNVFFDSIFGGMVTSSMGNMVSTIYLRAFLSPGAHIAWAAMEGAFLIIVLRGKPFKWSTIFSPAFLSLCILPIAMHALWDAPILNNYIIIFNFPIVFKLVALVVLALIIILVILQRGLTQINKLQTTG